MDFDMFGEVLEGAERTSEEIDQALNGLAIAYAEFRGNQARSLGTAEVSTHDQRLALGKQLFEALGLDPSEQATLKAVLFGYLSARRVPELPAALAVLRGGQLENA